ncbi:N-acetyltransferase [Agromyces rhizosphaerae]|uniref:N-acetyltransferase n=1 Tax=Agromyces rhizosphaerae TaxID=88374 RepID=A0A9W6CXM8_9MICO|nr:GNAT family N-acetyltransferase [Agromyces rhizosphaerae]GLI27189.1 N-acetyltransferase [Agromyces rhizosphaerae]
MPTTLVIRAPEPHEAETLARLHVETWRETYTGQLPDEYFGERMLEQRRSLWNAMLGEHDRDDLRVSVAEADGELVGLACSGRPQNPQHPPRPRQLYMIYVSRTHHGTGAGQGLLDAVLGDDPAYLWVAKENPRAQAFYARNGFALDGVEHPYEHVETFIEARMVR